MKISDKERTEHNIKNAIEKIGLDVSVVTEDGYKKGIAVISPVRYEKNKNGCIDVSAGGRSNPDRYMMFACTDLLKDAKYGDSVVQGSKNYMILWVDEYESRAGNYIKAYLRRKD